jgi:hypothetical protein
MWRYGARIGPGIRSGLGALGVPPGRTEEAVAVYRAYCSETGIRRSRLYDGSFGCSSPSGPQG